MPGTLSGSGMEAVAPAETAARAVTMQAPTQAAGDAVGRSARVHDGVGRQVKLPGDDGRGGARRRVPESPRDGFLAPEGARTGTAAMRGRPVEHGEGRGATSAGRGDRRGATTTRAARRGTTATGGLGAERLGCRRRVTVPRGVAGRDSSG